MSIFSKIFSRLPSRHRPARAARRRLPVDLAPALGSDPAGARTRRHPSRLVWGLSAIALITTVTIASIPSQDSFPPVTTEMAITPPTETITITQPDGRVTRSVVPGVDGLPASVPGAGAADDDEPAWTDLTVQKGDTLAGLLERNKLSTALLAQVRPTHQDGRLLYRLIPGQVLRVHANSDGSIRELVAPVNGTEALHLRLSGNDYELTRERRVYDTRQGFAAGRIEDSLFADGQNAGLSDGQILELAEIFGWDIDFAQDLRQGDSFSVVYEERVRQGLKIGDGPILAAEFVNRGKRYRAVGYPDAQGVMRYYSPDGMSLRRAFLRSPVKFSHVTSRFSLGRFHPILKTWRAHTGVDYGAAVGTPVLATASGRVLFVGQKGGYGNTVVLKHGGSYSTLYAHLSRFQPGVRVGGYVEQGQVIAYVGQTGLATGPHLHYEFQVNGSHRNPLTYQFPQAEPIAAEQRRDFIERGEPLLARLDRIGLPTRLAQSE